MATTEGITASGGTLADLIRRLGSVSLERIPALPAPGTATEKDVLTRVGGEKRLYELVDGVLVEKPMGYYESLVAAVLIGFFESFLRQHDLGIILGADATLRLAPGLVRLPDVSFISWERFPGRELPAGPIPDLAPDLAVEVLSESNTQQEMERKIREYFAAGTKQVWLVDPRARTVECYSSPDASTMVSEDQALDGGDLLPGFELPLRQWFERAGRQRGAGSGRRGEEVRGR